MTVKHWKIIVSSLISGFEIFVLLVRAKRGEVTRSHICHGIPEEKEEEEVKEMSLFVCTVSLIYFSLPFRVSVP